MKDGWRKKENGIVAGFGHRPIIVLEQVAGDTKPKVVKTLAFCGTCFRSAKSAAAMCDEPECLPEHVSCRYETPEQIDRRRLKLVDTVGLIGELRSELQKARDARCAGDPAMRIDYSKTTQPAWDHG
ncbi:MAG: hypothetical protein A3J07_03895 [Candidatus Doudnabacteria bacterium RIFCSPLOWO2_02_FULL_49_13]|uniref:Uncharacterized protein n=1 Tax=Candidatus Doudnabacteria bacterium RIFCSPHIGHO2_12_FULL_48_16 TaxID=1817838 RepID=A0A1F5PJM8_9BACT|nr:MAG: hypothetical protein A3B77_02705 [Candidatus Doudnabacteria bacterium RIFCSPHIGHO2_02_FULL_49_24]OGE89616.1 MAG: hypothetical protein A2760_03910 [Candidatus Doudnabacteria bacterium RIFCSPHIGHO2_01_FULL_50_67]OGE90059.1 MAG: hypothetical protein A3E29_03040 [Candidatus Doudnabacteria bacterium RIFCSPHIGHO2_12_FULL_48_16]OGE96632.1 MAG: hypothetical protein A2990_00350 [Candidatus Doudnabacteria bacterium RIFCSPLOWO2_01_FULL_49_40]OGF03202.1 MAG: hypothetical protein A3J07_03895 [Candid